MRPYFFGAGFVVVESENEEAAWEMANQQSLDAAIVDLSIPPCAGAAADQSCGNRLVPLAENLANRMHLGQKLGHD
jgi:DNA-binding response OmpR family regulator